MTWLGMPALISSSTATAEQIWPGRAVAALIAVVLHEGGLHRMQVVRRAQALDGGDLVALVHHRERQAGVDPPAVDDHRAGAALAVVAALLGAGEMQVLAQRIEQRGAGVDLQRTDWPFTVKETRVMTGVPTGAGWALAASEAAAIAAAAPAPTIRSRRFRFSSLGSTISASIVRGCGDRLAAAMTPHASRSTRPVATG